MLPAMFVVNIIQLAPEIPYIVTDDVDLSRICSGALIGQLHWETYCLTTEFKYYCFRIQQSYSNTRSSIVDLIHI